MPPFFTTGQQCRKDDSSVKTFYKSRRVIGSFRLSLRHMPRSRFFRLSDRFTEGHASDRIVYLESHVSLESLNDFKKFLESGPDQLELNDMNFDDLYLLNVEWKCHLDTKLRNYANAYFKVDKFKRLLECIRKRISMNNPTFDLEVRLQQVFCETKFDICEDLSLQECVRDIGIEVFFRVFEMDNHKVVREHLNNVFDFSLWCIDDDRFGACGSYLLKGVDVHHLTNSQWRRLRENRRFDASVLNGAYLESTYLDTRCILLSVVVLVIVFLASLTLVSFCCFDQVNLRRELAEERGRNDFLISILKNLNFTNESATPVPSK